MISNEYYENTLTIGKKYHCVCSNSILPNLMGTYVGIRRNEANVPMLVFSDVIVKSQFLGVLYEDIFRTRYNYPFKCDYHFFEMNTVIQTQQNEIKQKARKIYNTCIGTCIENSTKLCKYIGIHIASFIEN